MTDEEFKVCIDKYNTDPFTNESSNFLLDNVLSDEQLTIWLREISTVDDYSAKLTIETQHFLDHHIDIMAFERMPYGTFRQVRVPVRFIERVLMEPLPKPLNNMDVVAKVAKAGAYYHPACTDGIRVKFHMMGGVVTPRNTFFNHMLDELDARDKEYARLMTESV